MKHSCTRAIWIPIPAVLLLLSACSTTAEAPATPQASAHEATPSAHAIPERQDRHCVVLGDVAAPGPQSLDGDMTIFEAVTRAQPHKNSANLGRVRLIRADPRDPCEFLVDLRHIIETGDSTLNLHIQDRDVIIVPAAEPVEPK
jgi:hypothetical protein